VPHFLHASLGKSDAPAPRNAAHSYAFPEDQRQAYYSFVPFILTKTLRIFSASWSCEASVLACDASSSTFERKSQPSLLQSDLAKLRYQVPAPQPGTRLSTQARSIPLNCSLGSTSAARAPFHSGSYLARSRRVRARRPDYGSALLSGTLVIRDMTVEPFTGMTNPAIVNSVVAYMMFE